MSVMKLHGLHSEMRAGKGEEGEREGLVTNRQEVTGSDRKDLGWCAAGFC